MENCVTAPFASVEIGRDHYRAEITADGHTIISDEPLELGGNNEGMNSSMLLLASLGSCSAITLRMYADRKKWPLDITQNARITVCLYPVFLQKTVH